MIYPPKQDESHLAHKRNPQRFRFNSKRFKLKDWPVGQCALERACYLRAARPKARHQLDDFCSAPLVGFYAAPLVGFYAAPLVGFYAAVDSPGFLHRRRALSKV